MGIVAERLIQRSGSKGNPTSRKQTLLSGLFTMPSNAYRVRRIDAKLKTILYRMASDDRFLALQAAHIKDPDAPAYWTSPVDPSTATLRWALESALEDGNTPLVAHFLLRIGRRRVAEQVVDSPGRVSSVRFHLAMALADQHRPIDRTLWYLWIAWRVAEFGNAEDARKVLRRLIDGRMASVGRKLSWQVDSVHDNTPDVSINEGTWTCWALARLMSVDRDATILIQREVLDDELRTRLVRELVRRGELASGEEVYRIVSEPTAKVSALLELGTGAGLLKAADAGGFLESAELVARMIDGHSCDEARVRIAVAWAGLGETDRARSMLRTIESAKSRSVGLRDIVFTLISRNDLGSAKRFLDEQSHLNDHFVERTPNCWYVSLAICRAALGQIGDSLGYLERIEAGPERNSATAEVAGAVAGVGIIGEATLIALGIRTESDRGLALARIASHVDEGVLARGFVTAASWSCREIPERPAWAAALARVTASLARSGFHRQAINQAIFIRSVENRVATAASNTERDPRPYAGYYEATLRDAALSLASSGKIPEALEFVDYFRSRNRSIWLRHEIARVTYESRGPTAVFDIISDLLDQRNTSQLPEPAGRPYAWNVIDAPIALTRGVRESDNPDTDEARRAFIEHCSRIVGMRAVISELRHAALGPSLTVAFCRFTGWIEHFFDYENYRLLKMSFLPAGFVFVSIFVLAASGRMAPLLLPVLMVMGAAIFYAGLPHSWGRRLDRTLLSRLDKELKRRFGHGFDIDDFYDFDRLEAILRREISRDMFLTFRHVREATMGNRQHDASRVASVYDGPHISGGHEFDPIAVRNWALREASKTLAKTDDLDNALTALDASGEFDRTVLMDDITMGMGIRLSEAPNRTTDWAEEDEIRAEIIDRLSNAGRLQRASQETLKLRSDRRWPSYDPPFHGSLTEAGRVEKENPADSEENACWESFIELLHREEWDSCREVIPTLTDPELRTWATILVVRWSRNAVDEDDTALEQSLSWLRQGNLDELSPRFLLELNAHGLWMIDRSDDRRRRQSAIFYAIADIFICTGRFPTAVPIIESIIERDFHSLACRDLAMALARRGHHDTCVEIANLIHFDRAEHIPAIVGALAKAGARDQLARLILSAELNLSVAYGLCGQLVKLDPDRAAGIASILIAQGRYDNERAWFEDACRRPDVIQLHSRHERHEKDELEEAFDRYTTRLANLGEFDEAIRVNEERLESGSARSESSCRIGTIYLRRNRIEEAEGWFLRAAGYDPKSAEVCYQLGKVYLLRAQQEREIGRLLDAVGLCKRASSLRMRGRCSSADISLDYRLRGVIYRKLGLMTSAIAQFQWVARSDPDLPRNHYYLGVALAEVGRYREAEESLDRETAREDRPDSPYWVVVSTILRRVELDILRGNSERARAGLEHIAERYSPEEEFDQEFYLIYRVYVIVSEVVFNSTSEDLVSTFAEVVAAYEGDPIDWSLRALESWMCSRKMPPSTLSCLQQIVRHFQSACAWEPPTASIGLIREGMLERGHVSDLLAERGAPEFHPFVLLKTLHRQGNRRVMRTVLIHVIERHIIVLISTPIKVIMRLLKFEEIENHG